jgi:hypothetical protein
LTALRSESSDKKKHIDHFSWQAIEQYVRKLKPDSAEEDWPEEVREAFRAEHQAQADAIAQWRRIEDVTWWGWLNPFLVVWRGRKGGEAYIQPSLFEEWAPSLLKNSRGGLAWTRLERPQW